MATGVEDLYVVFLRGESDRIYFPEAAERPISACATYGEARRIQRLFQRMDHECVIRYQGDAGGGD
jgi:hypothetical protein